MRGRIFFVACLIFVASLSFYKLTESPPTWMDEGVITQVARNMSLYGRHAVQIAPDEFVSGSFITTAYPATFPASVSFSLFGVGILQSRVVMALFILVLFGSVYALLRQEKYSDWFLLATLLLVATFGPLYGHGKNLLGEIPGLCYLFLSFVFIQKIYWGNRKGVYYILAGLFFGLAAVTKPIYILMLPVGIIVLWLYRKQLFNAKLVIFGSLPILLWLFIQFQGDTWESIVSLYSNPNSTVAGESILANLKRFFTEAQPLYTALLFGIWTITGIIRHVKKRPIIPAEAIAWGISLLMLLAYIRTAGFYRYFFPAEFLSLVFIAGSLRDVFEEKYHKYILLGLALLICLQIYQTFFRSWVATYYEGSRSAALAEYVGSIPIDQTILFYQVPEAVNFLNPDHTNYYQFVRITRALALGEKYQNLTPDVIVTSGELGSDPRFAAYANKAPFDRYVILRK